MMYVTINLLHNNRKMILRHVACTLCSRCHDVLATQLLLTIYGAFNTSVILSASNKMEAVFVTIIEDEAVELNEGFFVRFKVSGELADAVELEQRETQVIITNNDGNAVDCLCNC